MIVSITCRNVLSACFALDSISFEAMKGGRMTNCALWKLKAPVVGVSDRSISSRVLKFRRRVIDGVLKSNFLTIAFESSSTGVVLAPKPSIVTTLSFGRSLVPPRFVTLWSNFMSYVIGVMIMMMMSSSSVRDCKMFVSSVSSSYTDTLEIIESCLLA